MNNWNQTYGAEYTEFLGLQNTGFGQWINRTFSKKKAAQQQSQANQNASDSSAVFSTGLVDTAPSPVYTPTTASPINTYPTDSNGVSTLSYGSPAQEVQNDLGQLTAIGNNFAPNTVVIPNSAPPAAPKKNNTGTYIGVGVLVALAVGGIYYFKKHHKK